MKTRRRWLDPRTAALLAPVQTHWLMGMSALAVSSFLMSLDPLIGRAIIDEGLGHKNLPLLWHMLVMIAAVTVLALVLETIGLFLVNMCVEKVRMVLQSAVARTQLGARSGALELTPGEFQHRATAGVHEATQFFVSLPARVVRSVVQLVWIGCILTVLSPKVGGATLVATVTLALLSRKLSDRIAGVNSAFYGAIGAVAGRLQQLFAARALIRQYHRAAETLAKLAESQNTARGEYSRLFAWESAYHSQQTLWSVAFTIGVIAITGLAVVQGKLTIGQYIAISIYAGRIQGPIRELLGHYKDALKGLAQYRLVVEAIDESHAAAEAARDESGSWAGAIEASRLAAGPLAGASFRIARGSRVLFAGENEAELAALSESLAGTLAPESGSLTVGGRPLAGMPLRHRRRWAATIAAEPSLIPGTLVENIALGGVVQSDELRKAIAAAGLEPFVSAHGVDARIDPGQGLTLELKHRIQLARALLLRSELVLVEDFTASLDAAAAHSICEALTANARTIVAVGLRDRLLDLAEQVIWVEGGACEAPQSIDAFLSGPRAARLVPRGRLSEALQGQGAQLHAERWARRHEVELRSYAIELFGDEAASAAELPEVAESLRRRLREADLVFFAGKTRIRCVCFGGGRGRGLDAATVERRLVRCVHDHLKERGVTGVRFIIQPEQARAA